MATLDDAIAQRVEIEFDYDGQPRVVRPAAHGIHKDTGNEVLRGYQVGGRSNSRQPPLWDLFLVNKIANLHVTSRVFQEDPPFYSRDDKAMHSISTQL
jgi:hypothetical protein